MLKHQMGAKFSLVHIFSDGVQSSQIKFHWGQSTGKQPLRKGSLRFSGDSEQFGVDFGMFFTKELIVLCIPGA